LEFRIAERPTHDHLLDEVRAISDHVRQTHREPAEPLFRRWTGTDPQFAKVDVCIGSPIHGFGNTGTKKGPP